MIARYFTKPAPKASFYIEDEHYSDPPPTRDIFVAEHHATDTGIMDHNGNTIMRAPNPMGFIW